MSRRKVDPPAGGWSAVTASVRGSSHDRTGQPNQDAVEVRTPAGAPGWLVAAVADGHGGQRYVRSGVGSQLAVTTACDVIEELLAADGTSSKQRRLQRAVFDRAAPLIVEQWRARVAAHLEANPFAAEEHVAAAADLDVDPPIAYGSTLILAVMTPSDVGLLQIGDGDALVVGADGSVVDPVPGDDRLVGGETTSLCLPTAVADARAVVVPAAGAEVLVLSSDGYGNSFASDQWRRDAGSGFLDAVRRDGLDGVGAKLEGWLADSALAGGDDVTMVVAHLAGPTVSAPPAPGAANGASPRPKRTRGRVVPALLLGALLGLVVGGAVAWIVKDDGASSATAAAESIPADGTVPDGGTSTTLPSSEIPLDEVPAGSEWIIVPGKLVTFNAAGGDGDVVPSVTLAEGLEPQLDTSGQHAIVALDHNVVLQPTGGAKKTIVVEDGDAAAVRVVDDTVWVADIEGRVRSYDLSGKAQMQWQSVQGATD